MAAFCPIASTPIAAPIIGTQATDSVIETASAADVQSGVLTRVGDIAESATAVDVILEFEILTETASASDAPSCALIRAGALTERAGAREAVLSASLVLVASAILEAATASDLVKLPTWTDNADDDQTWSTNTASNSVWTNNSHAESTWTEN